MNPITVIQVLVKGAELVGNAVDAVRKFSRKRAPGQEDHWYPTKTTRGAMGLRVGQCGNCRRHYLPPLPKRGCGKQPVSTVELP